jgi:putative transposase
MRRAAMLVHAVWATWERLPFLDDAVEKRVHGAIAAKCRRLGCPALAIGGTADHVHLLAQLHPSVPLSRLVGEAKGYSSFLMNREIAPDRVFRWQERYYASAVALDDLPAVERYVQRQRLHHDSAQLLPDLEPPHVVL